MIATKGNKLKTELEIVNSSNGGKASNGSDHHLTYEEMRKHKESYDKNTAIVEAGELNSSRVIRQLRENRANGIDISNAVVHSPPQSLKSVFQQHFPSKLIEGGILGAPDKPVFLVHVSCASDNDVKEQMTGHLQGANGSQSFIKEVMLKTGRNVFMLVLHRNDLDCLVRDSSKFNEAGKDFNPIHFNDESGTWAGFDDGEKVPFPVESINILSIIELARDNKIDLFLSFDEVHQHVAEDKAIHELHKRLDIGLNKFVPNIFCLYVTATGSGLHKFLSKKPHKCLQVVLKRPMGYFGFDFLLSNKLIHDIAKVGALKVCSSRKIPLWYKIAPNFYKNCFEYMLKDIQNNLGDRTMPYGIMVRLDGGRGPTAKKNRKEVEKLLKNFASQINADIVHVDSSSEISFKDMNRWLKSPPCNKGALSIFHKAPQRNRIFVLKRMVGCGQTVCTDNVRWWVEPPMSHEDRFSSYIQRCARVLGLNKTMFTQLLAWEDPIITYQDACDAIDVGDYGPMASLPTDLVKAGREKDWGWSCTVIDKSDPSLTLKPNAVILKLSTLAKKKGDLSTVVRDAIVEKDHYVNPINRNKVGGSPNAYYAKAIEPTANAYILEIDGKHPQDEHNTWENHLKQHQGKYLIVYRSRKDQFIEKELEVTENAFYGKSAA